MCNIACKLFCIIAATSLAFFVFSVWLVVSQGVQLQQQQAKLKMIHEAASASKLNRLLLEEAFYTIEFLMSNGLEYREQREALIATTVYVNNSIGDSAAGMDSDLAEAASKARTCLMQIHTIRGQVTTNMGNSSFTMHVRNTFVSCSQQVLELEGKLLVKLEHADATKLFVFSRIIEEVTQENIYGIMYFDSMEHGWSNASMIAQLVVQREHRNANIESLRAMLSSPEWSVFTENCSTHESRVILLESMVLEQQFHNVTPGQWMNSLFAYGSCIATERRRYENLLSLDVLRTLQLDIAAISVVCCLFLSFVVVASVIEAIFAKSIIDGWKSLMSELSSVISKFVPQGALKLMNCNSVLQLQLGVASSADLTVLCIEIQNFELLCMNMKLEEVFQFTNAVLSIIGPVVRSHGGFVEKYVNNGLLSVFSSSHDAVQAALGVVTELQNSSSNITPQFRVAIGCYRATFLVGVVGENQRIESTIISTQIVSQLVKLNAKYRTTILVSESVISDNQCMCMNRPLGQFSGYNNDVTSFYEVLAPCSAKAETLHAFREAMSWFQKANFKEAVKYFKEVLSVDSTDTTAEKLLEQCCVLQENEQNEESYTFSLTDILNKPILKQLFRKHLILEFASENLSAWEAIANISASQSKKQHLQEFYDLFLAPTAKYMVNVTETVVKPVRDSLATGLVDLQLLVPVKQEITFTMLDSFERFKRTGAFTAACKMQPIKENITEYAKIK